MNSYNNDITSVILLPSSLHNKIINNIGNRGSIVLIDDHDNNKL